ncbi:MAG: hypothetical protein K9K66_05155 [Desulfarculaceae bacterium]|nr:hypothetical protein [Desulfarculaceae bacterium]MCF8072861.1 hypothetical protein [Desulfarculaceae bacterium]MCF8101029.1 hypothetical protein [Desulfarculaceae bacterium]MCF8115584.1 hypothetical protein [Desulfarculaceae bacterium]
MRPKLVHISGPGAPEQEAFALALAQALAEKGVVVGLLRPEGPGVALSLPQADQDGSQALALLRGLDLVFSLLPPAQGQETLEAKPGAEAEAADLLAGRLERPGPERRVTLLADGKQLPAKAFVQDILVNTLAGMLAPLHGIEDTDRLEIIIE